MGQVKKRVRIETFSVDLSQAMHHPGQMSNLRAALAIQRIERCRYGKVRREINNGGS